MTASYTSTRTCSHCGETFKPSSRHKNCPPCRNRLAKTPCFDCGAPCGRTYERCQDCRDNSGEGNPNWRGGKVIHSGGYPQTRVDKKYVFDHVLVIEKRLGRKLLDGENVHHVNGIKTDNRNENLELWTRPQPSGIRASDALSWAREMVARYESIEDLL